MKDEDGLKKDHKMKSVILGEEHGFCWPKKTPTHNYYKLPEGHIWNPFLKLPRNGKCPCDSGKRFKSCCLKLIPRSLGLEELKKALAKEDKKK